MSSTLVRLVERRGFRVVHLVFWGWGGAVRGGDGERGPRVSLSFPFRRRAARAISTIARLPTFAFSFSARLCVAFVHVLLLVWPFSFALALAVSFYDPRIPLFPWLPSPDTPVFNAACALHIASGAGEGAGLPGGRCASDGDFLVLVQGKAERFQLF